MKSDISDRLFEREFQSCTLDRELIQRHRTTRKGEGVVSTHWQGCDGVATNSGHQILDGPASARASTNSTAHATHTRALARARARLSPRVCISAWSNWTANDSICQTNEFVRCHSMPRRTARESPNWIWFNVARIAAHYTLEISQISRTASNYLFPEYNAEKPRAGTFTRTHILACASARVWYAEALRERVVSSACVRPREIPDFNIMEIAVSAYQLRARIYPVLEKHFRATVARVFLHFERHVTMRKTNGSFVADDVYATSHFVGQILRSLRHPCNLQLQRKDKNCFELLQTNSKLNNWFVFDNFNFLNFRNFK